MKKLIFIVGKTNSGKDTVAKLFKELYNIPMVCSYTTRSMRNYEIDGVQHYFINKADMTKLIKTEDIIAYTKSEKTGVEYCATVESLTEETMIYIINPDGIKWFKEHGTKEIEVVTIYVDLDNDTILNRGLSRGDDIGVLKLRLESESREFNEFKDSKEYDYYIDNSDTYEELKKQVEDIAGVIL